MGLVHASGGNVGPRFNELLDRLLIVVPHRVQLNVTVPGSEPFDATICDVYVCDGVVEGICHQDMWVTQKVVRDQLTEHVGTGNAVLGRLIKPAGKRYYKLEPPTEDEEKTAARLFPQHFTDTATGSGGSKPPAEPATKPSAASDEPPF